MDSEHELIDIATIRSLPRSTTPWQMSFRSAPPEADRAGMYRLLIIVSAGANTIRLMRATTQASLPTGTIIRALEDAMTQVEGDLVPARPPAVLVDDADLVEAIELPMRSCGVEVRLEEELSAIDPVIEALGQRPGLFSDRTLIGTSCYEAELAEAAAKVASAEPWRYFVEELPIAVHTGDDPPCIVVVMGTLGQIHGVACYEEDSYAAAMAYSSGPRTPGEPLPFDGWSLIFEPASSTSITHRSAIASRQLPVGHALYPQFRRFHSGAQPGEITNRHDARRIERILHGVARLIEEHGYALLDGHWQGSEHELAGGSVRLVARPDLAAGFEPQPDALLDDESPFIEESVREEPDDSLPQLIPADHMMLVMDVPAAYIAGVAPEIAPELADGIDRQHVPCLVIRATKKNARAAHRTLCSLDALAFLNTVEDGREIELIVGLKDGEQVGLVSVFGTTHDQPLLAEELADAVGLSSTHVVVVLVGGGTRRPPTKLDRASVVGAVKLELYTSDKR